MNNLQLIHKYCPQFKFHENEQWFPCSIEWYLDKCNMIDESGNIIVIQPTTNDLTRFNKSNYVLHFDEAYTNGQPLHLNQVPIYVAIFETEKYIYLQYCLLFAYNGPSKLFAKCPSINKCGLEAGCHCGELEHITIKIIKATKEFDSLYYGAHRRYDGCWCKAKDVLTTPTGNPIVYVALGSHACYPEPGGYTRLCGLTCDRTSDQGRFWNPIPIIIDNGTNWNTFIGYLGQPHENQMPRYHEWWGGKDSKFSANWLTRLICCCV